MVATKLYLLSAVATALLLADDGVHAESNIRAANKPVNCIATPWAYGLCDPVSGKQEKKRAIIQSASQGGTRCPTNLSDTVHCTTARCLFVQKVQRIDSSRWLEMAADAAFFVSYEGSSRPSELILLAFVSSQFGLLIAEVAVSARPVSVSHSSSFVNWKADPTTRDSSLGTFRDTLHAGQSLRHFN